ncbi:phage tail tube protein [Kocuria tytonis]|uniref:Phage tail protein n=1 Tax=Kocuria tytonis TaxID=2054280 RepID=A0A495A8P5_9MICC|nr:hypothetical protein [Kocuria tytonis]RKQ36202.1 hypothetical protein C1C97_000505 [Kocuria tytonis]
MANATNTDNVRVYGSQYDAIYIAPIGTPDPEFTSAADLLKPLGKDYTNVGWLNEDGIPLAVSTDVEKFKAHQGAAMVRSKVTATERSLTIGAIEESPLVTGMFFDHGAPTKVGTDLARVDFPKGIGTVAKKAIVILNDGDVSKALVISRLEIGEREDISHTNSELTGYTMTGDITGEMYMLTNSKAYLDAVPAEPGA